jgi:hypothetical protein
VALRMSVVMKEERTVMKPVDDKNCNGARLDTDINTPFNAFQ